MTSGGQGAAKLGVGLWTMRSTPDRPVAFERLYEEFVAAAAAAEQMGFDSIWVSEHHFWHDGYCPSPLVALGAAAGCTSRIGLGTCVAILTLHEPERVAGQAMELWEVSEGRLELGVGMGYRDVEFDAFGRERRQRGRLFEKALDVLQARFASGGPRVWVGANARPAVERAAARGLGLLLAQTLRAPGVERALGWYRSAGGVGPVALLRDVWVDDDRERARRDGMEALRRHYAEEAGSWWVLRDEEGRDFGRRKARALAAQIERALGCALTGSPAEVVAGLAALPPVDLVIVRVSYDSTPHDTALKAMERVAAAVRLRAG